MTRLQQNLNLFWIDILEVPLQKKNCGIFSQVSYLTQHKTKKLNDTEIIIWL